MASDDKEVYEYDGFDLALANKLLSEKTSIICNDGAWGHRSIRSSEESDLVQFKRPGSDSVSSGCTEGLPQKLGSRQGYL